MKKIARRLAFLLGLYAASHAAYSDTYLKRLYQLNDSMASLSALITHCRQHLTGDHALKMYDQFMRELKNTDQNTLAKTLEEKWKKRFREEFAEFSETIDVNDFFGPMGKSYCFHELNVIRSLGKTNGKRFEFELIKEFWAVANLKPKPDAAIVQAMSSLVASTAFADVVMSGEVCSIDRNAALLARLLHIGNVFFSLIDASEVQLPITSMLFLRRWNDLSERELGIYRTPEQCKIIVSRLDSQAFPLAKKLAAEFNIKLPTVDDAK